MQEYTRISCTIDISEDTTDSIPVNVEGLEVLAIEFPAMTGTTISFKGISAKAYAKSDTGDSAPAFDDANLAVIRNSGATFSVAVTDSVIVSLSAAERATINCGVRWLQIISGTAELADRTIYLLCKILAR